MTGEAKNPHEDNDDVFSRIMQQSWGTEPVLRNSIDAGIRRLLDDARNAEDALNAAVELSEEMIQEVLLNLNAEWDALGLGGEPLAITGKLRPTSYAIEQDVSDATDEGAFSGLIRSGQDIHGDYFTATGFRVEVQGFDVETIPLGEHGSSYRIVMELQLSEDYNDEQAWFTIYPDEIEFVEAYQPTREGAEEFVMANYPDVYSAVQALPDNCQDPELIRQALDDFVVTFDLSKADTAMGEDEILDLIETYITDRLAFDNSTYEATVDGRIYGRSMNYQKVPRNYRGTLRELLVSGIRLFPNVNVNGDSTLVVYRAALETWYLVPESQGGRTPIYIPIDSLKKIIANRPSQADYPFDEDTFIVQNEQFEQEFEHTPLANILGQQAVELTAQVHNEPSRESQQIDTHTEELERQRMLLDDLRQLHETAGRYVSSGSEHSYQTEDEARHAAGIVRDHIATFFKKWEMMDVTIEVSGDALRIPSTKITREVDEDAKEMTLSYKDFGVTSKDMFANAKGRLLDAEIGLVVVDDNGRHAIHTYLEFQDITNATPTSRLIDPETGLETLVMMTSHRFAVDLGLPAGYSIPNLDYEERRDAALKKATQVALDRNVVRQLTDSLQKLMHGIDNESDDSFMEYEDTDGLRDIALSIGDDPDTLMTVADAIEVILGHGRPLSLMGPFIDEAGEIVTDGGVSARLDAIVTEHPHLKKRELAFIMLIPASADRPKDLRVVVPMSTIEEMAF